MISFLSPELLWLATAFIMLMAAFLAAAAEYGDQSSGLEPSVCVPCASALRRAFHDFSTRDADRAASPGGLPGPPRLADHDAGALLHRAHGCDRHSGPPGAGGGHPPTLIPNLPIPRPGRMATAGERIRPA